MHNATILFRMACLYVVTTITAGDDSQKIMLPKIPSGRYDFLARPISSAEELAMINRLPITRIELTVYGPPDNLLGVGGSTCRISYAADGTASSFGERSSRFDGNYHGEINLREFGKLCLLVDSLENGEPHIPLGAVGAFSNVTFVEIRVHRRNMGDDVELIYRNDMNFGDYRLWLLQTAIEGISGRVKWEKGKHERKD